MSQSAQRSAPVAMAVFQPVVSSVAWCGSENAAKTMLDDLRTAATLRATSSAPALT